MLWELQQQLINKISLLRAARDVYSVMAEFDLIEFTIRSVMHSAI
jgi:hypothetical protein